jgi:hypothetical protein
MKFTLKSGVEIDVTQAPYRDAMALHKALLSSIKGLPISDDILKMDISILKDAIVSAAISQEVEDALFKCGERATYANIRITQDLFDDTKVGTKAREDFYEIAWRIIEVNCGPFFKGAFSRLKAALPSAKTASPAS